MTAKRRKRPTRTNSTAEQNSTGYSTGGYSVTEPMVDDMNTPWLEVIANLRPGSIVLFGTVSDQVTFRPESDSARVH